MAGHRSCYHLYGQELSLYVAPTLLGVHRSKQQRRRSRHTTDIAWWRVRQHLRQHTKLFYTKHHRVIDQLRDRAPNVHRGHGSHAVHDRHVQHDAQYAAVRSSQPEQYASIARIRTRQYYLPGT